MSELRGISMVNSFPIGEQAKTREELLSKVEVVSYLSRFQEQFSIIKNVEDRESIVKQFLGDVIILENEEKIPDLITAEKTLKLTPGFLEDYNKVQVIKENNPLFNQTFNTIASSMDLSNIHSKSNER